MRSSIAAFLLAASSFTFTAVSGNGSSERLKIKVEPESLGGAPVGSEDEGFIYMTITDEPVSFDFGGVYELTYAELLEGSYAIVCVVETQSGPNELPPPIVPSSVGQVKRLRARSSFLNKNAFTKDRKLDRKDNPIPDAYRITCRKNDAVFKKKSKRDVIATTAKIAVAMKKRAPISSSSSGSSGGSNININSNINIDSGTSVADKINENEVRITVWPKIDGEYDHKVSLSSQGSGKLDFNTPSPVQKATVSFGLPGAECAFHTDTYSGSYKFSAANPLDLSSSRPGRVTPVSVFCAVPEQGEAPPSPPLSPLSSSSSSSNGFRRSVRLPSARLS